MLRSWAARKKDKHSGDGGGDSSRDNNGGNGSSGSGSSNNSNNSGGSSAKIFGVALPTDDLASLPKGAYNPAHFIDGIPVVVNKTIRYLYKHGKAPFIL